MFAISNLSAKKRRITLTGAAWDSGSKTANVTLSNSNYTATITNTSAHGFRSTRSLSSGKNVFEILVNQIGATTRAGLGGTSVGLGTDTLGFTVASGATDSVSYREGGWVQRGSGNAAFSTTYTTGDIIMLAYDASSGKIWVGKNGTWDGSPEAGTGNSVTMTAGTALYPMVSSLDSANSMSLTIYSGTLNYAAPSGFSAWG